MEKTNETIYGIDTNEVEEIINTCMEREKGFFDNRVFKMIYNNLQ